MLHVHKKYKKSKGDERACPGELLRFGGGFGGGGRGVPKAEEKAGQSHRFKPKNCHRNVAQTIISKRASKSGRDYASTRRVNSGPIVPSAGGGGDHSERASH